MQTLNERVNVNEHAHMQALNEHVNLMNMQTLNEHVIKA